ncbi:hypothetical protein BKA70DRAFT_1535595 [Coprinopsis sp. MPI-PUGE-AT-0042]|nr:hypothetical protein BKA70DRAFT_1535595 [Coprinopsis sp. MPI-PUGE-AT-0042]
MIQSFLPLQNYTRTGVMVKFDEIPLELLSVIAKAVLLGDVLELRLVCKTFAEAMMGVALRRIVIDTTKISKVEDLQMHPLKTLAEIDEQHPVRARARTLEIKCFKLDPDLRIEALNYLKTICCNLSRVKCLVWSWVTFHSNYGSLDECNPILQALQPMTTCLEEVEFLAFQMDQIPLLDSLSLLKRLVIHESRPVPFGNEWKVPSEDPKIHCRIWSWE